MKLVGLLLCFTGGFMIGFSPYDLGPIGTVVFVAGLATTGLATVEQAK